MEKCVGKVFKLGVRKEELGMKENSEFREEKLRIMNEKIQNLEGKR